jgi:hypothetical protein
VALGLPLTGEDDEAAGCEDDPAGWEAEPTGCTSLAEIVELDALASGPVPLPEEVGGRMPLETDDRDEVPAGPETALVEVGGRMGFTADDVYEAPAGTDEADEPLAETGEAGEVPAGADEEAPAGTDGEAEPAGADEEPAGPDVLLVGEGGRIGFGDEAPTGSDVAVMRVVDEEVRVTGQTVVETAMTMVLTGQLLMPGPQL